MGGSRGHDQPGDQRLRSSLTGPEKRRLNHPNAVINRWRRREKAKAIPAEDKPLSPIAKERKANIELQEELHRLKKNGDINGFTRDDTNKDIAIAVIGTFDGLSTKVSRVKGIARAMLDWVKEQEKLEPAPPKPPSQKGRGRS